MENFVVSARKYRPNTFDTVVGQAAITSTLKNAIKNNHLAQAFLFCGSRGVGKTTCARILAKTINCFNPTENIEACDECDSCKSFNEGHSLNIYELDAASNNSVDDIRNLIEQVRFAPQIGTHKVYIIDEVHMLSQAAFNAFLKTLEEPPKHAIFILATTEKHKIIPTILSRCQIFDFNRIQVEDIANHLAEIARKEEISADNDALHIIAQKADGALRDALSIFDQIVSFSGKNITYDDVINNLNILDYDYYFKVVDAIKSQNIAECLLIFNTVLTQGFDGHNFINGLAEHLRNILVCKDANTVQLLEVGKNIREKYLSQANSWEVLELINALNHIAKADINYKTSKNQRLLVELLLMQLCSSNSNGVEKKNFIIDIPKTINHSNSDKILEQNIKLKKNPSINNKPNPEIVSNYNEEKKNVTIKQKSISDTLNTSRNKIEFKAKSRLKTISINVNEETSNSKLNSNTKNEVTNNNRPKTDFTQEQFVNAWNNYKNKLKKQNMASLAMTFEKIPELSERKILIQVDNKALADELTVHKTDILDFLRLELHNYDIDLEITINKNSSDKVAYTPQEKYKNIIKKNPNIVRLVQDLNLEIGYSIQ